jgi:hypothetical protein
MFLLRLLFPLLPYILNLLHNSFSLPPMLLQVTTSRSRRLSNFFKLPSAPTMWSRGTLKRFNALPHHTNIPLTLIHRLRCSVFFFRTQISSWILMTLKSSLRYRWQYTLSRRWQYWGIFLRRLMLLQFNIYFKLPIHKVNNPWACKFVPFLWRSQHKWRRVISMRFRRTRKLILRLHHCLSRYYIWKLFKSVTCLFDFKRNKHLLLFLCILRMGYIRRW